MKSVVCKSMKWAVVFLFFIVSLTYAGPKWDISEDSWMKLSLVLQPHASYTKDAETETDFYLRRARIVLTGQVMDGVKVFAETDSSNMGRSGSKNEFKLQDAFIDFQLAGSDHWIKTGLILLPFSYENKSSAASLLGVDYNVEAVKLVNTFVWRDYGAELHGSFVDKVEYSLGVFDGYDVSGGPKNPDAELRFTGHVGVNLLGEACTAWFYPQNDLGKANFLRLGAGFDMQNKATRTIIAPAEGDEEGVEKTMIQDNEAWVADFQSGFGISEMCDILINGAYYQWDNKAFDGNTAFVETGMLYQKKIMPTFKYSLQDADGADTVSDYTIGLDYFLKGHNVRGGLEYRFGDSSDWWLLGLQLLI